MCFREASTGTKIDCGSCGCTSSANSGAHTLGEDGKCTDCGASL